MCMEGKNMTTDQKNWTSSKLSSRISEEHENNNEDLKEIPKLKKQLRGRRYKELVRLPAKKAKGSSELSIQEKSKMSKSDEKVSEGDVCDNIETTNAESISDSTRERVDFVLRRINYSDHEERIKSHDTQTNEKHFSSEFVEYWVPVRLSNLQTEQYCSALFSNKLLLSSFLKHHHSAAEVLHDLLNSTRKCCDHPYLVNLTLPQSLRRSIPESDKFHAEIKLSSKLDLLHKTLLEIKKRGLRVLILFQSLGVSGPIKLGDILDDILHEEFGVDSYARIHGDISLAKQQAALKISYDEDIQKFAFLVETRACTSSLEIPPVDTVIIFNSDLDPMNDLKALQKVKIKSKLKIFRFYSFCTVEEKVLILAKKGMNLEANVQNFNKRTYHGLLSWGAHYLFNKLDEFHELENRDSISIDSSDESFMNKVFHEMSRLLPNDPEGGDCKKNSHIVEAKQIGGIYDKDIYLPGELDSPPVGHLLVENEPVNAFWLNLFEGRKPRWKYFSTQSSRTRKRFQYLYDLPEVCDEAKKVNKICWKEDEPVVDLIPTNFKRRKRNKRQDQQNKEREIQELTLRRKKSIVQSRSSSQPEISPGVNNILPSDQQMHPTEQDHAPESNATIEDLILPLQISMQHFVGHQSSCSVIEMELERLQKERTQIPKMREDAIQEIKSAYKKEIDDIRKKYNMLLQNAETSFIEKTGALESRCEKMKKNKALADAIVQKKAQEIAASSSQESLLDELCQLLLPESRTAITQPEQLHEYPSTSGLIPQAPQGFAPPLSLVQTSNRGTTLGLSGTSNQAPMLCLQPVYGRRAPAPHLNYNRQFRPIPLPRVNLQNVTCNRQTQGMRVQSQQFPLSFVSGALSSGLPTGQLFPFL